MFAPDDEPNPTIEEVLAMARAKREELEARVTKLEERVSRLEAEARLRELGLGGKS